MSFSLRDLPFIADQKRTDVIGGIRRLYQDKQLLNATLTGLIEEAPAIVEVLCDVSFLTPTGPVFKTMCFRLVYRNAQGIEACRLETPGAWVACKGLYDVAAE